MNVNQNKKKIKQQKKKIRNFVKREHKAEKVLDEIKNLSIYPGPNKRKSSSGKSAYFKTLMMPELYFCKLPRRPVASILIKRKITYNFAAGTLGALGIAWNPASLSDVTDGKSTLFMVNNATYDGVSTIGTPASSTCQAFASQITANTVCEYRVISASMHVIPQTSVLNQSGSIHGGVIRMSGLVPNAPAFTTAVYNSVLLTPNLMNDKTYTVSSVSAQQGLRLLWYPQDEAQFELLKINTNHVSTDANAQANQLIAVVTGAAAAAPFRVDCYINYEVTPAVGSSYQGLETLVDDTTDPFLVINDIIVNHYCDLVTQIPAASTLSALGNEIVQGRIGRGQKVYQFPIQ